MSNRKEENLIMEAYHKVLGNVIKENVDAERANAKQLVATIVRTFQTTHEDQWPEELFIELRDTLNRIVFHQNHAAEGQPPKPAQPPQATRRAPSTVGTAQSSPVAA